MSRSSRARPPRVLAGFAALALAGSGAAALLGPGGSYASSHREAPLTAADPQIDNTDVYAFRSPDNAGTTTLVANWIPFEEPAGGPNFYQFSPDAHYDINIDNNGDAKPDLTYRWVFTTHIRHPNTFLYNTGVVTGKLPIHSDAALNIYQTYDLSLLRYAPDGTTVLTTTALASNVDVAPSDVGIGSMPNYANLRQQAITPFGVGGASRTFAGQADDPFFLDLRVFDLLYGGPNHPLKETGNDTLTNYNVNSVALSVPTATLALNANSSRNPVIGVWSTTERQSVRTQNADGTQGYSGSYVQVSRLGNPLVNEVVVPVGAKDHFNASQPVNDSQFLSGVTDPELARDVQAIYGIPAPKTPRNDLVAVFLTGISKANLGVDLNSPTLNKDADQSKIAPAEELRLNVGVPVTAAPKRLGVLAGDAQGYPNGRRLGDDVVDIALQAVEGVLLKGHPAAVNGLGDGVNSNDARFSSSFPYVSLPHSGSTPRVPKPVAARTTVTAIGHGAISVRVDGIAPNQPGGKVVLYLIGSKGTVVGVRAYALPGAGTALSPQTVRGFRPGTTVTFYTRVIPTDTYSAVSNAMVVPVLIK